MAPAAAAVLRLTLATGLLSSWLALLLLGWSFHGAVYLLLVAALALFPWRLLRGTAAIDDEATAGDGDDGDDEGRRPS